MHTEGLHTIDSLCIFNVNNHLNSNGNRMATVRQYFFKSVKNFFLVFGSIAGLVLICMVIGWLLPVQISSGLVLALPRFINELGIAVLFGVIIFFGCKAVKLIKAAEAPQKEFMRMAPSVIIWLSILLTVSIVLAKPDNSSEFDCENYNYNKKLNGGVKEFNGRKYIVNICGGGGGNSHFFRDGLDAVQLTVRDEHGTLLVKRHYKIFWDGLPGHEPIGVEKNRLTYYDDEDQDEMRSITMPPTLLDWIKARISLVK